MSEIETWLAELAERPRRAGTRDVTRLLALVRQYREALTEGLACLRLAADTARIHGNERLTVTLDNACRQVSAAMRALTGDERHD